MVGIKIDICKLIKIYEVLKYCGEKKALRWEQEIWGFKLNINLTFLGIQNQFLKYSEYKRII